MFQNNVSSKADLLNLLDELIKERDASWWTKFYTDPNRKCPFFTLNPNEDLVEFVTSGYLEKNKRVLEIGCGNGRNAIYLAEKGFDVTAIDFSESSIKQANENMESHKCKVNFVCDSIFNTEFVPHSFDFVYDCGCFHHITPHRRPDYLETIVKVLRPEGYFGLTCFAPGGGSDYSDIQVYENKSMSGGLSFTEESISRIFSGKFTIKYIRGMKEQPSESNLFGKNFLWVILMQKKKKIN